jgi:galactokinase/mevalonate kinase-like predicted kinase
MFNDINWTDSEICKVAYEIEKTINPFCGYQDPYGCGMSGFKRMDFKQNAISYEYFSNEIFETYDMHLVYTGITDNDRALTLTNLDNVLTNNTSEFSKEFYSPGHIFLLIGSGLEKTKMYVKKFFNAT